MEAVRIIPTKHIQARIQIPGSKYIANRIIPIAVLCDGVMTISNLPDNDDIDGALVAMTAFGVKIERQGDRVTIDGNSSLSAPLEPIDVGGSGTLLRFISAFAALVQGRTTISGNERIRQRPIGPLARSLCDLGVQAITTDGCPPLTVDGGSLKGGETTIEASISSQFISALLLCTPCATNRTTIRLKGEVASRSYIDMTLDLIRKHGVKIDQPRDDVFLVNGRQRYHARDFSIPGDSSSASYFLAAAALSEGRITVKGLDGYSQDGEAGFSAILEKMGCRVERESNQITVSHTGRLCGLDLDMSSMPDTVQTLAVLACYAEGPTTIRNIGHLRYKESDRIEDTAMELRKCGATVHTTEESMTIIPGSFPERITIDTHNDHRTAMSFALVGINHLEVIITNPRCVEKSFPDYWRLLRTIGVDWDDV